VQEVVSHADKLGLIISIEMNNQPNSVGRKEIRIRLEAIMNFRNCIMVFYMIARNLSSKQKADFSLILDDDPRYC